MASATMRENSISRKVSQDLPPTPLVPLRHYVEQRFPELYKPSCDYFCEGQIIMRAKRFMGVIVDRRPIGQLPDQFEALRVFQGECDAVVIGERLAIEEMRKLETQYWSVCNRIAGLFTLPCPVNIPTSRLGGGAV